MEDLENYWDQLNDDYISHASRLGKNRLVVSAVICAEDKVLVVRRAKEDTYPGLWEFPGGGVDEIGESVVQALRREVLEETGISLPEFPTGEVMVHPTRTALRIVLKFDLDKIMDVILSHEHDEYRFVDVDEAKTTFVDKDIIFEAMRQENQSVLCLVLGNSMSEEVQ
ncbi:MAG: NUDIX hydrolase [Acidimicrobiia bacterium]